MSKVTAIIAAAGRGRRFGSAKQFASLQGKSILEWCLEAFGTHPRIDEIVLVLPDEKQGQELRSAHQKISAVVTGGEKRQDSVSIGFSRIDRGRTDIVLIHDGARPLVTKDLIRRVIEKTEESGAAIPVVPLDDTVKDAEGGEIVSTLDRSRLVSVQTPQGFAVELFKRALEKARADGFFGTDDAALVERLGEKVYTVRGDPRNIKITSPRDIKIAEALLDD